LSVLTYTYLYSSVLYSSLPTLILSPVPPLPHSFYTCRYLHILIYIILWSSLPILLLPKYLTPHVLSEWMVEVCGAYLYRVGSGLCLCFEVYVLCFDPARSIGVDGWGVWWWSVSVLVEVCRF
jgi:hypothetical protein